MKLLSFLISIVFVLPSNFYPALAEKVMPSTESHRDWGVFVPQNKKECFIASQAIKMEAFKNGEKLSSVNRGHGRLFIWKSSTNAGQFEGVYFAGFPLQIGSKPILTIDGKEQVVFLASPKPSNSEEKNYAWNQVFDDQLLIESLKKGNKAIMESISHRNTKIKDSFVLTGFTTSLERMKKLCN